MQSDLRNLVYEHDEIAELDPAERRLALRDIFSKAGLDDIADRVAMFADEIDGFGPISDLMRDPLTTDIVINGPNDVWVETCGVLRPVENVFDSTEHLIEWCGRHITHSGGRVDTSHPIADTRLSDGSRMHVVFPPIAPNGPLVSIRRFPHNAFALHDLEVLGSVTAEQVEILRTSVTNGRSIVVSGATGSGKTTLLNALLALVPATDRVVVIEELPELSAHGPNRVSLVGREPNAEGRGEIGLDALVRASLRMRPDRIIVGEVRGPEALPALWAMRTGHSGAMLSVHAASAAGAARRLVDLALMAERAPAESTLIREVDAMVDVFVHVARAGGGRAIEEILVSR